MLWFMMDNGSQPLYVENARTGEIYQVLDVINDGSIDVDDQEFNAEINNNE